LIIARDTQTETELEKKNIKVDTFNKLKQKSTD